MVVTLLRHLDRALFEPHLVVFYRFYGFWFEGDIPPDVTMHVLEARHVRRALPQLVATIWRIRPAVIVSTQGYINFAVSALHALFPRVRLVLREVIGEREFFLERSRYRGLLSRFYLYLLRRADRIVTQSDAAAVETAARIGSRRPGQVVCIHNPVDVARLEREARANASPFRGPGPHVLALGRLTHQKGFDLLLEAFAGVRAAGIPAELTIVGEGEAEDALRSQAARLGVAAAVRFAGFQDNPPAYYGHADVFVLSSRYEGMPNAVLEAMACGCPVVAFDCPHGVREIIDDGVNGVLVPPEDVSGLRDALLRVLCSPETRERLRGRMPRKLAAFDAPAIARRWADILAG